MLCDGLFLLPRGLPGPGLLFWLPLCFFSRGGSVPSLLHFCCLASPEEASHGRACVTDSLEKRMIEPKLEKVSSGGDDGVGMEDLPVSSSSSSSSSSYSSSSSSSSFSSSFGRVTKSGEETLPAVGDLVREDYFYPQQVKVEYLQKSESLQI